MNPLLKLSALLGVLVAAASLVGCSSNEENPITPDKMNQIRAKEAAERGSFNPDMKGAPPAPAKPPTGG